MLALERWKNSGLSVEEFCILHKLSIDRFLYWQAQIAKAEKAVSQPRQNTNELFVPVQVSTNSTHVGPTTVEDITATTTAQKIEIVIAGGRFILRLSESFHSGKLYQIIAMLEGFGKC